MTHRWKLAVAMILVAAGCARAPVRPEPPVSPHPALPNLEPGTLVDPAGEPLDLDGFLDRVASARYVLVGENHDQACDHEVQASLLSALASRRPVVGLEMVDVDHQPTLDLFAAGEVTLDELPEALEWKQKWGLPFELYLPVFEAAHAHGLPVVALNLPRDLVRKVGEVGLDGLGESERALLPPQVIEPPEEQQTWLRARFDGHPLPPGEDLTEQELLRRFLRVQSLWDTQMAWRAVRAADALERPVVVLAGAGHVVHGWGITHRLAIFDPQAEVIEIVPWRGLEPLDADAADVFFYCPARRPAPGGVSAP